MAERIYHIATASDWAAAKRTGSYTTSTLGRTLQEEGFIHASRREQVSGVWRTYYRDVREPLLLLVIDPQRLESELRDEPVGDQVFPHIHGPLNTSAVVGALPLNRRGGTESMLSLMVKEMAPRIGLLLLAMLLSFAGAALGERLGGEWAPFVGGLAGLLLGAVILVVVLRRRR